MGKEITVLEAGIAGMEFAIDTHSVEGRALIASLIPDTIIKLVREPDNRYDPWAIALTTEDGVRLGYISKYKNEAIARMLDAGVNILAKVKEKNEKRDNIGKTKTENMMIPLLLFVEEDNIPGVALETSSINYQLKAAIAELQGRLAENVEYYIETELLEYMEEISLMFTRQDGKIAWQEVEFLELYFDIQIDDVILQKLTKKDGAGSDFKALPKCLVDVQDKDIVKDYFSILKAIASELIACDRRVTKEEENAYQKFVDMIDDYLKIMKKDMGTEKGDCLAEAREYYEMLDFEVKGQNVQHQIKRYVARTISQMITSLSGQQIKMLVENYYFIFHENLITIEPTTENGHGSINHLDAEGLHYERVVGEMKQLCQEASNYLLNSLFMLSDITVVMNSDWSLN